MKHAIMKASVAVLATGLLAWLAWVEPAVDETIATSRSGVQRATLPPSATLPSAAGAPTAPTLSPFAALDCSSAGSLISRSSACAGDAPLDERELTPLTVLRNALAALSQSNPEAIHDINAMYAACTDAHLGKFAKEGAAFEQAMRRGCDPAETAAVVEHVDRVVAGMGRSARTDEFVLSWLYTRQRALGVLAGKITDVDEGDGKASSAPAPSNPQQVMAYEAARNRLQSFLESMNPRDEFAETMLQGLNFRPEGG